jgi:hypothetical protein
MDFKIVTAQKLAIHHCERLSVGERNWPAVMMMFVAERTHLTILFFYV